MTPGDAKRQPADDALERMYDYVEHHGDSKTAIAGLLDTVRDHLASQEQGLHRLNTRLTKTNKDRHQWRERAISAEQQLALHGPSDELQRLREEREDTAGIAGLINRMKQAERRASRNVSAAETYKQRAEAAEAEVRRLTEGLRWMADYNMTGSERTLHIDFQGKARALLADSPPEEVRPAPDPYITRIKDGLSVKPDGGRA